MLLGTKVKFDAVVIGGGPAGENAADYILKESKGKLNVALVEAELLGGECSYYACMPSKALLRAPEIVAQSKAVKGVVPTKIDVDTLLARRDEFTHNYNDASQVKWANSAGITVVRGRGRIKGEKTVEVTTADGDTFILEATEAVVIATGSVSAVPAIPGLPEGHYWTSRDVTSVKEIPKRLAIIGGGVVACESATWMTALGCQCTIYARSTLLPKFEPFAGELVAEGLKKAGVQVHLKASVDSFERQQLGTDEGFGRLRGHGVTVNFNGGQEVEFDELLIATGRRAATSDVGLDTIGLQAKGALQVDDQLTVQAVEGNWLYAIGDANGRSLLTHQGKYQGRIVGAIIAARSEQRSLDVSRHSDRSSSQNAIPQVVFTTPEVCSVGLTEQEAKSKGLTITTYEYNQAYIAGSAIYSDEYVGRAKIVVDASSDCLVGATFVGSGVSELLHSATVAIVGKVKLDDLEHAVCSYPTQSEVWLRLLEARRAKQLEEELGE